MREPFFRSLTVLADGEEIAAGCPVLLEGGSRMTLRPGCFLLRIENLRESMASRLSGCENLEVRSGLSVLVSGTRADAHTCRRDGNAVTEAVIAPGLALWRSAVSLTLPPGMRISETARAVLRASGTETALAGFTGTDRVFSRPQSFFGRTAEALAVLAAAADAEAVPAPGGVVFTGKADRAVSLELPEGDLLSAPEETADGTILRTSMTGWPVGAGIRYAWQGRTGEGRILSRSLRAENGSGPWESVLLIRGFDR